MQSLNIHDAKSVSISPLQEYNTSRWVTITVIHNEDKFEINLFTGKDDIQVTLGPFTLSRTLPNE